MAADKIHQYQVISFEKEEGAVPAHADDEGRWWITLIVTNPVVGSDIGQVDLQWGCDAMAIERALQDVSGQVAPVRDIEPLTLEIQRALRGYFNVFHVSVIKSAWHVVASVSSHSHGSLEMSVWDVYSCKHMFSTGCTADCVAISPYGLVYVGVDCGIEAWDMTGQKVVVSEQVCGGDLVVNFRLSTDSKLLVCYAMGAPVVRLIDPFTLKCICRYCAPAVARSSIYYCISTEAGFLSCDISESNEYICANDRHRVFLWQVRGGQTEIPLDGYLPYKSWEADPHLRIGRFVSGRSVIVISNMFGSLAAIDHSTDSIVWHRANAGCMSSGLAVSGANICSAYVRGWLQLWSWVKKSKVEFIAEREVDVESWQFEFIAEREVDVESGWAPTGRCLCSVNRRGPVLHHTCSLTNPVDHVEWSTDGQCLCIATGRAFKVYQLNQSIVGDDGKEAWAGMGERAVRGQHRIVGVAVC